MTFLKLERSCSADKSITLNASYGTGLCESIAMARRIAGRNACFVTKRWPQNRLANFNSTFAEALKQDIFTYAKENMMIVKVFIREVTATQILKDEKTAILSFIANTGGLMGLCMGFSVVSIFEILSHIWTNIFRWLKPSSKGVKQ